MFFCSTCNYKTNKKTRYTNHRRTIKHFLNTGEIDNDKSYYYCSTCNMKFYYKSKLEEHKKSKYHKERTDPIIKKFYCVQCPYWSYSNTNYNQHIYRHRNNGDLNIKKTIIKVKEKEIENLNNNQFVEDPDVLKNKINEIVKYLYDNKIDPNKHFNYEYYRNKNIDLSLIELNDFYQELNCILVYN